MSDIDQHLHGAATTHAILQLEAEIARLRGIDDDAQRRLRLRQERIDELCADNIALRSRLGTWERAAQEGHPDPCTLGSLCPYCEIDALTSKLDRAERDLDRLQKGFNSEHDRAQQLSSRLSVLQTALGNALALAETATSRVSDLATDDLNEEWNRLDAIWQQERAVETPGQTDEKGRPMTYWGGAVETPTHFHDFKGWPVGRCECGATTTPSDWTVVESGAVERRGRICDECEHPVNSEPHLQHCPEAIRG